jgi:hypothetical protein
VSRLPSLDHRIYTILCDGILGGRILADSVQAALQIWGEGRHLSAVDEADLGTSVILCASLGLTTAAPIVDYHPERRCVGAEGPLELRP